MGECPADGRTGLDVHDGPERLAPDPTSRHGSDLAGHDDAGASLAGLADRDGHVARVSRLAPGGAVGHMVMSPDQWNGSYETTSARRSPACS